MKEFYSGLIDPPSDFAPLEDWRQFLIDAETIEPKTPDIVALLDKARQIVKDRSKLR